MAYLRARKQARKIVRSEQSDLVVWLVSHRKRPDSPLCGAGKELVAGKQHMRLDRKPLVWGLYEEPLGDTLDLRGEPPPLARVEVFDHRVRKRDVELAVGKGKIESIPVPVGAVRAVIARKRGFSINPNHLDIGRQIVQPTSAAAADIEDPVSCLRLYLLDEQIQTLPPRPSRKPGSRARANPRPIGGGRRGQSTSQKSPRRYHSTNDCRSTVNSPPSRLRQSVAIW